jgi:hypothetical protein
MRAYIIITGLVFAAIVLAHVARLVSEGSRVASQPVFLIGTLVAGSLAAWSWRLLRRPQP